MKLNLYVDGSWLFKQCDRKKIFANRTESPGRWVSVDFTKMISLIEGRAGAFYGSAPERGVAYFCTSIFTIPVDADTWPTVLRDPSRLSKLRANVHARQAFADKAVAAGFAPDGLLHPTLRPWVLDRIATHGYQEKQVDTWLVAHLVERAISEPDSIHFIASGDADMMPGIQTVVPRYTERVVHVGTHPLQFDLEDQQTSFAFESFRLRHGPVYLEDYLDQFIEGAYVYHCRNPGCGKVFTRTEPPHGTTAGFCAACEAEVSTRVRRGRA